MPKIKKNYHYYSGKEKARECFCNQYSTHTLKFLSNILNAIITSYKYGSDKNIKKTKKGKVLTDEVREFYVGYADGAMEIYNEVFKDSERIDNKAFLEKTKNYKRHSKYLKQRKNR